MSPSEFGRHLLITVKKVKKVVIPAAGPRIELSSREVYVLDSKWRLCGADPAYSIKMCLKSSDG